MSNQDKNPSPDQAEHNAFFPSPYSLTQYTAPKTDFDGFKFSEPYKGGKYKVLVVATDERYVLLKNGKMFSTGNHPVETLLPILHMHEAGFEIEVATLSGNPAKMEMWAMPGEDEAVKKIYESLLPQLKQPAKLADIMPKVTAKDSPYIGVFIPGGHGALVGLPDNKEMADVLEWAMGNDRYVITLCHGPAALLAPSRVNNNDLFKDYKMCVFPDSLDEGANIDIGYLPGNLPWLLADRLEKTGANVINKDMSGQVHQDRNLLTGDSPLAANKLGILSADQLIEKAKQLG